MANEESTHTHELDMSAREHLKRRSRCGEMVETPPIGDPTAEITDDHRMGMHTQSSSCWNPSNLARISYHDVPNMLESMGLAKVQHSSSVELYIEQQIASAVVLECSSEVPNPA